MFFQKVFLKSLKKDRTKLQFFSSLIGKTFKAVLIQISFVGIIQDFFTYKTDSSKVCLANSVMAVLRFPFFNPIFESL